MATGARLIWAWLARTALVALICLALAATAASASEAQKPWPPATGPGLLFVHFGEEHWNDDDSDLTLPKVVAESAKYRPDLVTMSGDKDNDGTVDQLTRWKQIMSAFDRAGVPYLAGVGNHDRTSPPGVPPGTAGLLTPLIQGSLENYKDVFADRPYPFGDAAPYSEIGPARPAADPAGASSHYYAEIGNVRWIFLDNSCWGLADCNPVQNPPFPDAGLAGQFEFLEAKAKQATASGRVVFVVMHIPTRDPRDQEQIESTSFNHVMGKGISPTQAVDNGRFEQVAERSGVDGVFLGHIKGQWLYRGRGDVPYYVDGGAGGELYTNGPVGTDFGYWHGFRVLRVNGSQMVTDSVPIFRPNGITISGPATLHQNQVALFEAVGTQPKQVGRQVALELRDPDPIPKQESGLLDPLGAFVTSGGGMILVPPAALLAALVLQSLGSRRRRTAVVGPAAAMLALGGLGAVALAGDGPPTSTPKESLPNPARIWTTSDHFVLAPVPSATDDPRRNVLTQTADGSFKGTCPGRALLTITSGFEQTTRPVLVPSAPGPIIESLNVKASNAQLRLHQRAEVIVQVRTSKGHLVRTLARACFGASQTLRFSWDGKINGQAAPIGSYELEVLVLSDRERVQRRGGLILVR